MTRVLLHRELSENLAESPVSSQSQRSRSSSASQGANEPGRRRATSIRPSPSSPNEWSTPSRRASSAPPPALSQRGRGSAPPGTTSSASPCTTSQGTRTSGCPSRRASPRARSGPRPAPFPRGSAACRASAAPGSRCPNIRWPNSAACVTAARETRDRATVGRTSPRGARRHRPCCAPRSSRATPHSASTTARRSSTSLVRVESRKRPFGLAVAAERDPQASRCPARANAAARPLRPRPVLVRGDAVAEDDEVPTPVGGPGCEREGEVLALGVGESRRCRRSRHRGRCSVVRARGEARRRGPRADSRQRVPAFDACIHVADLARACTIRPRRPAPDPATMMPH